MPDVHAGAGCGIGFTGDLGDKVIPNIVGVDIGCGILVQPFVCKGDMDYHALNEFILHHIPSGRNYQDNRYEPLPQKYMDVYRKAKNFIKQLRCYRELKENKRLNASIGSPMAYKPKDEIIGNIRDTVNIANVIKPIYNFKAAE